ncbi:MAG TPA: O-antigen ligase family protein [Pyrinomonadaceae bacterium]|nr:O-antigen ligase family protein [Pyrinomonadaceae bacterium]
MISQQNSTTQQNGKYSTGPYLTTGVEGPDQTQNAIRIVRWVFYAFVFSLPFETAFEGLLEPTSILGGLLLLTTLLQPGIFLRWPPKAYLCFLVYLYLFAAFTVLEPSQYRSLSIQSLFVLAQLTVLGWIAYCVMRDRHVAARALLTFGAACTVMAIVQVTGVASQVAEGHSEIVRMTAFGFHPNALARLLMLGLLAIIGLSLARRKSLLTSLLVAFPFVALLGVGLIQTGSRGGLLALMMGLMTFVLRPGTTRTKILNTMGILLMVVFIGVATLLSGVMTARFEETLEDGDLARRERIYPAAFEMFQEKPFLGWGPITSTYELGMRLGHPEEETKNPHNLILFGFVTTGLLGSLPLFMGIGLAVIGSWRTRHGAHGSLPLAMLVAVMAANMSGLYLFNKLHWLVMAYAMASVSYVPLKEYARSAARPKRVSVNAESYASV